VALKFKLLEKFGGLFEGKIFRHRSSNQGDLVAIQFFEDLYDLGRSTKYVDRVNGGISVLNIQNRRHGVRARRGDGSFGEIVPGGEPITDEGYKVKRGPIATIEIGIEVKIIQKAMIRQIDRVINDLRSQVTQFRSKGGRATTVGIVGVNRASSYVSYEGDQAWPTTGIGRHKHPSQEADEAIRRLETLAAPHFDEFLILPFMATNSPPYPFDWVDRKRTELDYGAALARVSGSF
jgi:hypothetical protein